MTDKNSRIAKKKTDAAELEVGSVMPDGTIYAGVSPETNSPMYAATTDAFMENAVAVNAASDGKINLHGRTDWRVPTKKELNVLFQNRDKGALKGSFNQAAGSDASYYWSSSEVDGCEDSWGQSFSDGSQYPTYAYDVEASVRFILR